MKVIKGLDQLTNLIFSDMYIKEKYLLLIILYQLQVCRLTLWKPS